MSSHLWSFLERLTPRLISAFVLFCVAAYTDPEQLGLYSAVTLCYTAIASITDAPARQVLIHAVRTAEGRRVLARYRITAALGGGFGILLASGAVVGWHGMEAARVVEFAPLMLVPTATALGLPFVGRLQVAGRWPTLARGQLLAATISLVISVPLLLATHSVVAAATQALLTETFFTCWAFVRGRSERIEDLPDHGKVGRDFRRMAVASALGWTQAQADRIFIGLVGGPALLGAYSVASALARSIGDSLAAATANLLRAQVMPLAAVDVRGVAERVLRRSVHIATICAAICGTLVVLLAANFLGPEWDGAIQIVPVLAVSSIPSSLTWSGSVLQVKHGGGWRAAVAPGVGVLFAPVIGVAAGSSLLAASLLVVVRELAVVTTSFVLLSGMAPWRAMVRATALSALCALLVLALVPRF